MSDPRQLNCAHWVSNLRHDHDTVLKVAKRALSSDDELDDPGKYWTKENQNAGLICTRAHKFIIADSGMMEGVACEYGLQLAEFSLAQLPYDECVFQYYLKDTLGELRKGVLVTWQDAEHFFARLYLIGKCPLGQEWPQLPVLTFRCPRSFSGGVGALNAHECCLFDQCSNGDEDIENYVRDIGQMLFGIIGMLEADGVQQIAHPEPRFINKRRAKKGKPPLNSYTLVQIDPSRLALPGHRNPSNQKSSPKLHWRRGHIRRLQSGTLTKVRPTLVGDKSKGFARHDYVVRSA